MKKTLSLLCVLLTSSIIITSSKDDLKAQLTTAKKELKVLKSEIKLYNESQNSIKNAQKDIFQAQSTIKNNSNKIEDLTGVVITDGNIYYNNNRSSNKSLTDANIKLQEEIDDLTSENSTLDQNINTSRATLGALRGDTVTETITGNIVFYQDKIAEYKSEQTINTNKITKDRALLESNNDKIISNTSLVNVYQTEIDVVNKILTKNKDIISSIETKLEETPDSINFSNTTMIYNKINDLENNISTINYQISIMI